MLPKGTHAKICYLQCFHKGILPTPGKKNSVCSKVSLQKAVISNASAEVSFQKLVKYNGFEQVAFQSLKINNVF